MPLVIYPHGSGKVVALKKKRKAENGENVQFIGVILIYNFAD